MSKNYLIYPMKIMNITQNYKNGYSHAKYSQGTPKDYPIDDNGGGTGRSYAYCPCDEMKVVRIFGVGTGGTNTIWLTSTKKVIFADGTIDYVTIRFTHPNDDTLRGIRVGTRFKLKQPMFKEGNDGNSTGYHFHISVGKGKLKGNGWTQNSRGAWVTQTTHGVVPPQRAFFIDPGFTKVYGTGGLKFKTLPSSASSGSTSSGTRKVKYVKAKRGLNIRSKPSLTGKKIGALVYGAKVTVYETKGLWSRIGTEKWVYSKYLSSSKI